MEGQFLMYSVIPTSFLLTICEDGVTGSLTWLILIWPHSAPSEVGQAPLGTSSNPSDSILCLWMPSETATEEWHVAAQPCWGSELRANRIRPSRPGELLFCRREGPTVPGASSAPLGAGEAELQNPAQQEAWADQPCRESNLALLMRVFKEFNHSTTLLRSYPRLRQSNLPGYSPQCKLYQHQTKKHL